MNICKILFSVLFLIGFIMPLGAQSNTKDSLEIYQYWAQRGIIEMVFAYMEDHVSEKKISPKEREGMTKFKEDFHLNIEQEKNPNLDSASIFLKENGWARTENNILQPLRKRFNDTMDLDSNFFSIQNISGSKWDSAQNSILNSYNQQLAALSSNPKEGLQLKPVQLTPTAETQIDQIVELPTQSRSGWTHYLFYLFSFIAGIVAGSWVVFYISKRKIYNILHEEKYDYLSELNRRPESFAFKYLGLVFLLKAKFEGYKLKYKELVTKNKELISNLKTAEFEKRTESRFQSQGPIEKSNEKKEAKLSLEVIKPVEEEIRLPEKTKLFFSIPDFEGQFKRHNGASANDGKKFYCIEFEESEQEGSLTFISSDKDKRAINDLESYLKPVCNIENISDADTATQVSLISPGKVTLVNDSWIIDAERKVKVRLI